MLTTVKELKEALNIKTINVEWNDEFPDYMLDSVYRNTPIHDKILEFKQDIKEYKSFKVNNNSLYHLGIIAEMHDLMLAYIITEFESVDIFFFPNQETREWLSNFKDLMTRRQFFNIIRSARTLEPYKSLFLMSSIYQLTPNYIPTSYNKPQVVKLNDDYVLVQYLHDVQYPKYKVVKVNRSFKQIKPEISYNSEDLNPITLCFKDDDVLVVFKGDNIKHLYEQDKQVEKALINVEDENNYYHIDSEKALLTIESKLDESSLIEIELEGFIKEQRTKVVFDRKHKEDHIIIFSNGFIWNLNGNKFSKMTKIKGLEELNLELFGMSSFDKGYIIATNKNIIENVPSAVFEKFIFSAMK